MALIFTLLPAAAMADPPAFTFAELAERADLKAGSTLLVTFKLLRDGDYLQTKVKLISIEGTTMRASFGEGFPAAATDLHVEYADEPRSRAPFAEPAGGVIDIPESRVSRVATIDSLGNGILIGAGIGGGTTILGAFQYCTGDSANQGGCAAVVVAGAGIGAAIGALADYGRQHEGEVLFDAPTMRPPVAFSFVPLLSRERKGLAFTIRW